MKHVCLVVSLLAMAAGSLYASPTLACTGGITGLSGLGTVGSNDCFTTDFSTATSLDSLNWGAPHSATGESGFGAALLATTYPYAPVTTPVLATAALSNGDPVTVMIPGGASVTRADDLAYVYEGNPAPQWSSAANAGVSNFAGHFDSAGSTTSPHGDALIEDTGTTGLQLSLLGASGPVLGVWFEIASLSSNNNTTFTADVQAFDKNGNPLGTYTLSEGTSGYGTGGKCQGLTITTETAPTPCNDAPYVGFYDPQGQISSVYITVFNAGLPVGFAIDSLYVDEGSAVPEPAIPLLIGTGLVAMALYRRKRHARVG